MSAKYISMTNAVIFAGSYLPFVVDALFVNYVIFNSTSIAEWIAITWKKRRTANFF